MQIRTSPSGPSRIIDSNNVIYWDAPSDPKSDASLVLDRILLKILSDSKKTGQNPPPVVATPGGPPYNFHSQLTAFTKYGASNFDLIFEPGCDLNSFLPTIPAAPFPALFAYLGSYAGAVHLIADANPTEMSVDVDNIVTNTGSLIQKGSYLSITDSVLPLVGQSQMVYRIMKDPVSIAGGFRLFVHMPIDIFVAAGNACNLSGTQMYNTHVIGEGCTIGGTGSRLFSMGGVIGCSFEGFHVIPKDIGFPSTVASFDVAGSFNRYKNLVIDSSIDNANGPALMIECNVNTGLENVKTNGAWLYVDGGADDFIDGSCDIEGTDSSIPNSAIGVHLVSNQMGPCRRFNIQRGARIYGGVNAIRLGEAGSLGDTIVDAVLDGTFISEQTCIYSQPNNDRIGGSPTCVTNPNQAAPGGSGLLLFCKTSQFGDIKIISASEGETSNCWYGIVNAAGNNRADSVVIVGVGSQAGINVEAGTTFECNMIHTDRTNCGAGGAALFCGDNAKLTVHNWKGIENAGGLALIAQGDGVIELDNAQWSGNTTNNAALPVGTNVRLRGLIQGTLPTTTQGAISRGTINTDGASGTTEVFYRFDDISDNEPVSVEWVAVGAAGAVDCRRDSVNPSRALRGLYIKSTSAADTNRGVQVQIGG